MTKLPVLAALAAALIATPAQAEVVAQGSDHFVTRDTANVSADLRETWLMLITPGKWWNSAHTFSGDSANMTLTPQAAGCFCERIPADDTADKIGLAGSVEHMSVILSIPDQALRMEGGLGPLQSEPVEAILTVTLSETDEGTRIVFEYAVGGYMRFEVPVIAKAVDGVMSQQLNGLAAQLGPLDEPEEEEAVPEEEAAEDEPAEDNNSDPSEEKPEDDKEPKITVDEAFGDLDPGN